MALAKESDESNKKKLTTNTCKIDSFIHCHLKCEAEKLEKALYCNFFKEKKNELVASSPGINTNGIIRLPLIMNNGIDLINRAPLSFVHYVPINEYSPKKNSTIIIFWARNLYQNV